MTSKTYQFDWTNELHKTMVQSLSTTFGLDFLLFQDKQGGDVDTIHNVRKGIYATEEARNAYENREKYDSHQYHSHRDYITKGRQDKQLHQQGELRDNYRNQKMDLHEDRQLDHTISANEIHNDAGRVLANLDGSELANQGSNLNSTHWYINNLKRNHSIEKCINDIFPNKVIELDNKINQDRKKLNAMPENTPKQREEKRLFKQKIDNNSENKKALEEALKNKDSMIESDRKARSEYNKKIDLKYYTDNTFIKNTLNAAGLSGLKMGARQALGLMLAEVWFEMKDNIPIIFRKHKGNFHFHEFISDIKTTLINILERIKNRFKDIINTFVETGISGVLSSLTITLLNIFTSTLSIVGKLIRELWVTLVKVAKLIFFNPDNLSFGDLTKNVLKLLGTGVSIAIGSLINAKLNTVLTIPFGTEIATFLSALVSGLMTVGIAYYLEYSDLMKKVWDYLNTFFKNKYDLLLDEIKKLNHEFDAYLVNLAKVELNFNVEQVNMLSDSLVLTSDEYVRSKIFKAELKKNNIELPFEFGNKDSFTGWLSGLHKK